MKPKTENTPVPDELVKGVTDFHGHLGPFLVLGLKAGLLANSLLGKDCFKTVAVVVTNPAPPSSCFVDGIQFTTGCTMGKGNIKLKKGKGVSVLFSQGNKKLRLELKKEILDYVAGISFGKSSEESSANLLKRPAHELFKIER